MELDVLFTHTASKAVRNERKSIEIKHITFSSVMSRVSFLNGETLLALRLLGERADLIAIVAAGLLSTDIFSFCLIPYLLCMSPFAYTGLLNKQASKAPSFGQSQWSS